MNWDYIAGFFDGEGSAIIRRNRNVEISFANTNKAVLQQIREFVGFGNIHTSKTPKGAPYHQLHFANRVVCMGIAKELIPRCIIKGEKLSALVNFVEATQWKKIFRPYSRPTHLTPELLRHLYVEKKLSTHEIGHLNNCADSTVRKRMLKFGIPLRSISEAVAISRGKHFVPQESQL